MNRVWQCTLERLWRGALDELRNVRLAGSVRSTTTRGSLAWLAVLCSTWDGRRRVLAPEAAAGHAAGRRAVVARLMPGEAGSGSVSGLTLTREIASDTAEASGGVRCGGGVTWHSGTGIDACTVTGDAAAGECASGLRTGVVLSTGQLDCRQRT